MFPHYFFSNFSVTSSHTKINNIINTTTPRIEMTPSFYYILPVYTHQLLQIQNSLQIPIHEIIILILLLTLVVAITMLCYTHPFKKYIANNPTTVLQPKGITYHLHLLMNYQL